MVLYKRGYFYATLLIVSLIIGLNLYIERYLSLLPGVNELPVQVPRGDDTDTDTVKTTVIASTTSTGKKTCVLFAGPMKTGSTALERYFQKSERAKAALLKDNYAGCERGVHKVADCLNPRKNIGKNTRKHKDKCATTLNDFKTFVSTNAGKRNIMVPHENFARLGVNIDEFTSYLSPDYDIHVVLYYRRFYDWIYSLYNQIEKPRGNPKNKRIQPFRQWLLTNIDEQYRERYVIPAYNRYISSPGIFNVSIVNMHHDAANFDTVEAFTCGQLDDAPHSCAAAKSRPPDEDSNPSEPLDWLMFRHGLKGYRLTEKFDEKSWGKIKEKFDSMVDRPKVCLPDDLKDRLLQISLDSETSITPKSFYNSEEGLEGLKSDFEKKINTKLCDIDIDAIAMSPEWQGFLKGLENISRNKT